MGYQKTSAVILKNYIDKKAVVKEANKRGFSYFDWNNSINHLDIIFSKQTPKHNNVTKYLLILFSNS